MQAGKKNVNDYLKEYEDLLGEDLDKIEATVIPDDPSFDISNLTEITSGLPAPKQQPIPQQPTKPPPKPAQQPQPQQIQQLKQQIQQQQQQVPPRPAQPPNRQPTASIDQHQPRPSYYQPVQQYQQITKTGSNTVESYFQSINSPMNGGGTVSASTYQQLPQIQNLDLRTFAELFQKLLRRHKEYLNYVQYISEFFGNERREEIEAKGQIVERCHIVRNEILAGRFQVNLADFVSSCLPQLVPEDLHGRSDIQVQAEIQQLISQFEHNLNVEEQFQKIAQRNQPIVSRKGKKTEKITKDTINYQITVLNDEIKYLKSLVNQSWVPLPRIVQEQETREISQENKEIAKNELRIKLKRVMMGPRSWFYVTYLLNDISEQLSTSLSDRSGILNYSNSIQLTQDQRQICKDLHQKSLEVRIYAKHHLIFSEELCVVTVSLEELFWTSTIESFIPIPMQGYPDCKLEYSIQIRESIAKSTQQSDHLILHIQKRFPPLVLGHGLMEYEGVHLTAALSVFERRKAEVDQFQRLLEDQQMASVRQQLVSKMQDDEQRNSRADKVEQTVPVQQPRKPEPVKPAPVNQEPIKPAPEKKQSIPLPFDRATYKLKVPRQSISQFILHGQTSEADQLVKTNEASLPEGVSLIQALYPESPVQFPVIGFVEEYLELLKTEIPNLPPAQQRTHTNKQLSDFERIFQKLVAIGESGQFQEYIALIANLQPMHEKLMNFYTQIGLTEWQHLVQYRLCLLNDDLKQAES